MDLRLRHEFTLNPDGSGKVAVEWIGPSGAPGIDPRSFVREEIGKGEGIDAWGAASLAIEEERPVFRGVAYFPDLSKLRLHCQGMRFHVLDFTTERDGRGAFRLATRPLAPPGGGGVEGSLEEERRKVAQFRDFLGGLFEGLVCESRFHLPGDVGSVRNATKSGPRTVEHRFLGDDLLARLDRVVADDAAFAALLRGGGIAEPSAIAALLGDAGPIEVATKGPVAPAFDYAAEAEAARAAFEPVAAELARREERPPSGGTPLGNVRVVGVKLVREADGERELAPLGQNYRSLTLALAGDLPAPALRAEEGRLDAALDDAGRDLSPEDDWRRRIGFPKLTADRRTVLFEVEIEPPESEGFREVRGALLCVVAEGSEEIDFGFPGLEAGAASDRLGATIERFDRGEGGAELDLRILAPRQTLEALRVVDGEGNDLEVSERGYSTVNDESTLSYAIAGEVPADARILARVATGLRTEEFSFSVRDIDLLGRGR